MDAEIIGIGSELLLGQIVNRDAQYISQRLSQLGINVYYHTVVGDNNKRIQKILGIANERVNLIITTGGLGPTMDDLTKEMVAEFLDLPLVLDKPSLHAIEQFFIERKRDITENNYRQAYFPKGSVILPNNYGTAPGAIVEHNEKVFIILPGPPSELEPMFEDFVIPYLESKSNEKITSRVLKIYGIGESLMEDKIKDILMDQTNPTIAPLAGASELTLRLTAKTTIDKDPYSLIEPVESLIRSRLGDVVYGIDEDTLESVVVKLLAKSNKTIAIAESCSGGMIAERITSIPGASKVFHEGVVSYSNQSKIKRLMVSERTLEKHGAVSYQTAKEMVNGILDTTGADIGIGVTGIAGPEGGTIEKPIGTVYIGIGQKNRPIEVKAYRFIGDRKRIQSSSASTALDLARRILLNIEKPYIV